MGMGRRVSCPHFWVLEGTRRASDGLRTARSKGPALCRKAGRGVTAAAAGLPGDVASVLPAVPATQTVKPAACQDPLCPLALSCRFRRRTVANGRSSPYMHHFLVQKMVKSRIKK